MKVIIVGSGFSSIACSCYLAKAGYDVTILEKNKYLGGRSRQLIKDGFKFDMGPTWYWMPDVFESFFNDFGKKVSDYYELEKLSPAYKVVFSKEDSITISDNPDEIINTFEKIEKGSGEKLKDFLKESEDNYNLAIKELVYQPGDSIFEIISLKTFKKLKLFIQNISGIVAEKFKNPYLKQILEFPVLFLGAKPEKTPAFYNFMNFADFGLGTFHPKGGMYSVTEGMVKLASELGVKFELNCNVEKILTDNNKATSLLVNSNILEADLIVSGADYQHTESLLPPKYKVYSDNYWENKTFAPSALLFYVAFNKKIEGIEHHTLFFDTSFKEHAQHIYDTKTLPINPLFYASFPSKTDSSFSPRDMESATFLIPLAPDSDDTQEIREHYFNLIINRLENLTNQKLKQHILFYESFSVDDFKKDYNSFKGNAYGLANTLLQTHILRPKLKNKKLDNLYYTGQLTVPGPGVPPAIISGKIVSEKIIKENKK